MNDFKSWLCVGGPMAGKRYAVMQGTGFRCPVYRDLSREGEEPNTKLDIKFMEYQAETFLTPQGEVNFWVPKHQTPFDTITLLLETYERSVS